MGEGSIQDSASDSVHSKTSTDVLIAKSPPGKNKKERRRQRDSYDLLDRATETQQNSFKWIPNPAESILCESREPSRRRHKRQPSIHITDLIGPPVDFGLSTLDSDKTSSYQSDFASLTPCRDGYTRAKTQLAPPVEVQVRDKEELSRLLDEENSGFLITGGVQMMLGILMAVFGVLVIVHDASLAGAGGGLWGGAVSIMSGLLGVLAGLKGCYSSSKTSPVLITCYLALCLLSFALSNLVLVLTATGLIRDVQRPHIIEQDVSTEESSMNWAPVLADVGLILSAAMQCVLTVMAGYKCYKKVCPCSRQQHRSEKSESKEGLVSSWLGQQMSSPKQHSPWGSPNIVFLPPPPPMLSNGQVPILTFLQSPPSLLNFAPPPHMYYPPSHYTGQSNNSCCCPAPAVTHHKRHNYILPDSKLPRTRSKSREVVKERRVSLPTAEDVARTYTGLDREIAEEFIAIAMDKSRRSRRGSVTASLQGC